MRVLFVCHDPPAPANNGGSIDMLGMLESLHRIGCSVDVIYTSRGRRAADTAQLRQSSRNVIPILRNRGIVAAMSLLPYQIASRHKLQTMRISGSYDVVITSDHCSNVLLNPTLQATKKVLRRHNDESLYANRMARQTGSPIRKAFFAKEAWRFAKWKSRMDQKVDQIWYVSTEELDCDKQNASPGGPRRLLVPAAMGKFEFFAPNPSAIAAARVLYFGSLTMGTNRAAVDWYLANVHHRVSARLPAYKFIVAGRSTSAERTWCTLLVNRKDITFLPSPQNSGEVYKPGGIFIDPLTHDVGVKLKIIEAVRHGYVVVCAPNSLRGSGLHAGVHALVAENERAMTDHIVTLSAQPEIGVAIVEAAQRKLHELYDVDCNIVHAFQELRLALPPQGTPQ